MNRAMVWVGGACAALGLICCFTALLPIILGGLGLTGVLTVFGGEAEGQPAD